MYVADIRFGITSVETDCGTGAEIFGKKKKLLAHDQRLLEIFGQVPCQFGIFRSGLTSVEDVDAPNQSPREDISYGYVGIW